jgi:ABC-type phosphate transport system substrate-binding protein
MERVITKMTRGRFMAGLLVTATALCIAVGRPGAEVNAASGVRVIINPHNGAGAVERKFLTDVFLKKITRWGNMETIRPVDQRGDAPVRASFTVAIMRRSVEAVKTYWQQAVFSGRDIPPPELDSDDDVVRYVLRNPGGVGYVTGNVDLHGARVLVVR